MQISKHLRLAVSSLAILAGTTIISTAEEPIIYDAKMIAEVGGAERINYSGKLRMLSQRIPAAACNLHAGVSGELSKEILVAASDEFGRILIALEKGDPGLGIIGPEKRRKSIAALEKLKQQWSAYGAAVQLMMSEGTSESLIQQLADQNEGLLEAAKILVSELSGQYSDPVALVQSDAIRLDIAGRQRMLSQRMSKDFCLASSGINVEASIEDLKKITAMFEVSLTALRQGMPAAGIEASNDPEVIAALDVVAKDWEIVKSDFAPLKSGATNDMAVREKVFDHLNTLLVDMNKAVVLYSKKSKQQI